MKSTKARKGKRRPAPPSAKPRVHENPAQAAQRRRQLATHYAARYRAR